MIFTILLCIILFLIITVIFFDYYFKHLIRLNSSNKSKTTKNVDFKYDLYPHGMNQIIKRYSLESILNKPNDLEIALSAMQWVHASVKHTSNPESHYKLTTDSILKNLDKEAPKINCWMYSVVLNDLLLAKGISSRIIHLRPKHLQSIESHIVVSAFIKNLNKWVFLDPNYNAYLIDKNGTLLGIMEIRSMLANGEKIIINSEAKYIGDEPINNFLSSIMGLKYYFIYSKKNFYRYSTPLCSTFYKKPRNETTWVHYVRKEYVDSLKKIGKIKEHDIIVSSEKDFWKKP